MFSQPISPDTKRVLEKIAGDPAFSSFYLVGGTALAIQLEHRESIDLDWFSPGDFSNSRLKESLAKMGEFELSGEEEGTLHGVLDGVKISFLYYPYESLFPFVQFENVKLADERDISAMKIDAISSRGSKKDFIDIYFLLQKYSLNDLFDFFEKKYKNIKYNKLHILKSLVYFETAENEPMPVMIKKAEWDEVKSQITARVDDFLRNRK